MHSRSSLARLSLLIVAVFLLPKLALAASLYVAPQSDSYSTGKTFSVRVRVSTTQSINAVSGTLTYPTDKLQVTNVSKVGSILTLWVQDPSYDNSSGKVAFEGVVPNPGYYGTGGQVVVVTFRVVGAGSATVGFVDSSVLANDGNGTNVLDQVVPGIYALGGVSPAPADNPIPSVSGVPRAPTITSSTHPVSSHWYKEHDAKFMWTAESDVTATRVLLSKSSSATPTQEYASPITSKEVDNIDDGIWYLHVQNKNKSGWGAIAHYMIKVDGSDPETFSMREIARTDATDPRVRLSLSATDNFSGVKNFGIQIDKGEIEEWIDDGTGIYETSPLTPGQHSIFARVYDEAGNFSTASVNSNVDGIAQPKITSYSEKITGSSPLVVRGTALPNIIVRLTLAKSGAFGNIFGTVSADTQPRTQNARSDGDGQFSAAIETSGLESGAYGLSATAVDSRGAQSEPTVPKTVLLNASWLRTLVTNIVTFLAIAVPLLGLLFLLFIVFMRGYHTVRTTNRKFRSELHDVEELVDKSFVLLREDVEDSVRLLERTRSRRKLTDEEEAIITRLRSNLRDAEKVIHGEVKKIERQLT